MQYEIRVWKNQEKMPTDIKASSAKNKIAAEGNSALKGAKRGNPDILIDTTVLGENAITTAGVTFSIVTVKNSEGKETKVRTVKMYIKGNLYLPLENTSTSEENKKRDTLHLSKWAAAKPTDSDVSQEPYYRSVILSIITKAGDFRLISATNMYVESYSEDYEKGEFGTFELTLSQMADLVAREQLPATKLKVDGPASMNEDSENEIDKGIATAAAVATTAAAAKTVKDVGNVKKADDKKSDKKVIALVNAPNAPAKKKKAADTNKKAPSNKKVSLPETEKSQGDKIKAAPKKSKEDLKATAPKKSKENLKATSQQKIDAVKTAKKDPKKEFETLEKKYLPLIKKNPEELQKYNKATPAEKLKMLEDKKATFDDMQNNYLLLLKKDPKKYEQYAKANTATKFRMLEKAKQSSETPTIKSKPTKTKPEKIALAENKPAEDKPKKSKTKKSKPAENKSAEDKTKETKAKKSKSKKDKPEENLLTGLIAGIFKEDKPEKDKSKKDKSKKDKPKKNKSKKTKSDENKPEETLLVENNPDENNPDENKPEEITPEKNEPAENELAENELEKNQPEENQSEENQPEENQPEENQPEETESEETESEETESEENQPEENQPEENQSEENQPEENQSEENNTNTSLSGANLNDMLDNAVKEKNGN